MVSNFLLSYYINKTYIRTFCIRDPADLAPVVYLIKVNTPNTRQLYDLDQKVNTKQLYENLSFGNFLQLLDTGEVQKDVPIGNTTIFLLWMIQPSQISKKKKQLLVRKTMIITFPRMSSKNEKRGRNTLPLIL